MVPDGVVQLARPPDAIGSWPAHHQAEGLVTDRQLLDWQHTTRSLRGRVFFASTVSPPRKHPPDAYSRPSRTMKVGGLGRRARNARALSVLEQLEMGDKAASKAVNLSGGQKQRAVIARALVTNPRVIFADEPTGNLDTATGQVVEDILFTLNREQGITLVVVTHDEELASRCDRRVYLRDGRIVDEQERSAA